MFCFLTPKTWSKPKYELGNDEFVCSNITEKKWTFSV